MTYPDYSVCISNGTVGVVLGGRIYRVKVTVIVWEETASETRTIQCVNCSNPILNGTPAWIASNYLHEIG